MALLVAEVSKADAATLANQMVKFDADFVAYVLPEKSPHNLWLRGFSQHILTNVSICVGWVSS